MKHVFPERVPVWSNPGVWAFMVAVLVLNAISLYRGEIDPLRVLAGWAVIVGGLFLVGRMRQRNPLVSIDEETLTVLRPAHIPAKTWRLPVDGVQKIEIYGPQGKRHWRVRMKDSSVIEIPPLYNGWLDRAMTRFMHEVVSERIPVEIKPPPGVLAEVRGDYE